VSFLGVPLDIYDMDETIDLAKQAIVSRERLQHVALNVAKLINMQKDPVLRRDVEESDLIGIDGMGILWGCRLMGISVKERVAGIDLMEELLSLCEREHFRPYFFGASQTVLERAIDEIKQRHPKLKIAGYRNGYFADDEEKEIVSEIQSSNADCLFIAISTPIKENFLHNYRDVLNVPFLMGIGGSLDVVAGHVKRAPAWTQRLGLEWLYRLCQEPRRMWRRYLVTNYRYATILLPELFSKYLRRKA